MQLNIVALIVGIVFGVGLGLSGMTDPEKVLGFLDVSGRWDPSLMFVMGSAIPVYYVFWRIFEKRGRPLFDVKSHVPTRRDIDKRLVIGAAIFGIGWGVGGICPGPGVASLGVLSLGGLVFVLAFLVGARIESAVDHKF